jgi:CBS domain-containing protein
MKPFDQLVSSYMTANVISVERSTPIRDVAQLLGRNLVSAVPVCEDGAVVGVISRTDLIREGLLHTGARLASSSIAFPAKDADDLMSPRPLVVASSTHLREAAALMRDRKIHRVFVVDGPHLTGVLSAHDLARAVRDARVELPLSSVMSAPLVTVDSHAPISAATEKLADAHVSGVVVTDEGWPVGMFTQVEVLASRELPRGTRVDEVLDPSMVCLPDELPIHRAAATAFELGARRVIACRNRDAVGIVTGMDFVKIVATAT